MPCSRPAPPNGATCGPALHITSPNIDSGSAIAAYAEAAPKCAQWTAVDDADAVLLRP